jgi:hypothetical protein
LWHPFPQNSKQNLVQKKKKKIQEEKLWLSQELVAHAYNPSYSGGRDQEDQGSKPAWANSSRDCILKIPNTHTHTHTHTHKGGLVDRLKL